MAGIYDNVSPSGMIDTVFGNYNPNQKNKTVQDSLADAAGTIARAPGESYDYINGIINSGLGYATQTRPVLNRNAQSLIDNPGLAIGSRLAGNLAASTQARSDYASEHGGEYPPSQEALNAFVSLKNGGGSLSNSQPTQSYNNPVSDGTTSDSVIDGILGLGVRDPASSQVQQQQNEAKAQTTIAKQQQADAISKGYTPTPDASKDPAGFMAATNMNKAKGLGDASGTMNINGPTPPTENQQQTMQLNQMGKNTAFDMSKSQPWYKSQSFNYGLISFGLNLLSGNDLATSFNAAGQAFGEMYGQEQRQGWAQDLVNQGYSRAEIEEYIRTGDSKVLTDPMERQAKALQLQTSAQTLNNLQYENSPEMRQYILNREARQDALKESQIRNQMANDNARVSIARQGLQIRQDVANAKMNPGEDPNAVYYTDTDGRRFTVLKNARGTPLINSAGMATLYDPQTGETTWRNISENQRQMGGIQANEGLRVMDQVESSGLLKYSGNSIMAKANRRLQDELGNNVTSDLSSNFDNLNGAIRATLETQLMQENNNRPVQKFMLDTAVKRFGKLDINNSQEENARIISNSRSLFNSQYHARGETHPTVENRNYANPTNRPGVSFDNVSADRSGGLYMGQVVNGMTYVGGDPNQRSSWK